MILMAVMVEEHRPSLHQIWPFGYSLPASGRLADGQSALALSLKRTVVNCADSLLSQRLKAAKPAALQ
jgi:hypothetical protein